MAVRKLSLAPTVVFEGRRITPGSRGSAGYHPCPPASVGDSDLLVCSFGMDDGYSMLGGFYAVYFEGEEAAAGGAKSTHEWHPPSGRAPP